MSFGPAVLAERLAALVPGFPRAPLVVALSGGADSAALLHALAALARAGGDGPALRAIHVDHGLQSAATALRAAAEAVAGQCGVALTVLGVHVDAAAGRSVEEAAREARYAAFAAALSPGEVLLTAHHREDQAETALLQLLRGAGLRGLAAMPADAPLGAGRLLRPLLECARADLQDYAHAHALRCVEDPMNEDPRYDRAYLRREIWPGLVRRWPAAAETLARAAGHAAEAQGVLDAYAGEDLARLARGDALDVPGLLALHAARRNAVLRHWLARRGVRAPPARRLALVERELLRSRGPNGPRLAWDGAELRRFGSELHLVPSLDGLPAQSALWPEVPLDLGGLGRLVLRGVDGGGLAAARVAVPLAVRPRSGGERLRLAANAPRRPLKDLLREARVPPWVRERVPLLWDAGRLVAVVLPGGAWIAAEAAAAPGERGYAVDWLDAPAAFGTH